MKIRGASFLLLLVALAGCGHKASVVGHWKVDPEVASHDPAGAQPGFMTGFASTFRYNFKADNTFEGSMSTGTYTLDGNKLSVTTKTLMGKDISAYGGNAKAPQMTGDLSDDGKTLTMHLPKSKVLPASLSDVKMVKDE